jgi:hypothetical protein
MTSGNRWTPVEITVLLQVYYNAEEHNGLDDSRAHQQATRMWLEAGCIQHVLNDNMGRYRTTPRGDLMIEAWRRVQLP